jgi:hypothetical protein
MFGNTLTRSWRIVFVKIAAQGSSYTVHSPLPWQLPESTQGLPSALLPPQDQTFSLVEYIPRSNRLPLRRDCILLTDHPWPTTK